jgi:hypothetical protein
MNLYASPTLSTFLLLLFCLFTSQELLAQDTPPPPPPPGAGGGSSTVIIDGVLGRRGDSTYFQVPECEEVIEDSFLVINHTYRLQVDTSNLTFLDMTLSLTDLNYNGLLGNFQGQQDSVFDGAFDFYQDTATVPFVIHCDNDGCFLIFTLYFSSNFPAPPADTAILVNLMLRAKGERASFFEVFVPICPETREGEGEEEEEAEMFDRMTKFVSRQGRWQEDLQISPNPFCSQLTLKMESKDASGMRYRLFDGQGRLWRESKVSGNTGQIRWQTGGLAPGLYFLQVQAADGSLSYHKLLKSR